MRARPCLRTTSVGATYFVVVAGLLAVTWLAAYLPARRAAAVNPAQVLNGD
jgi:ABC-type lipoprotein release transport system permease subunit